MKQFAFALTLITAQTFAGINSPIPENERINALLEGKREITSLVDIEKLKLNAAATSLDLWSGSYWPHYQGSLAVRYRDAQFAQLMDNHEQYDKHKELNEKLPVYTYAGKENLLSPAEKYDLLVGDSEMTLTKYSWELGKKIEKLGSVPTWRGICDGWSSAAQSMPRPSKSVTLATANGTPITFFPEDIKALGSQLYARAQDNVIFLGKRCYSPLLRFTEACNGTNPGAFHKALVNRVGNLKKSFNADVSASSQVWNYPVKSYKISFYNVFTDEESETFQGSLELYDTKKKFQARYKRSERTYAIVGVKTEITFANMRVAHTLETDGLAQDKDLIKTYYYDLELDRNYNILGGEWFQNDVPDFIWAPNDRTYPISDGEQKGKPRNAFEITKAAQVSSKVGQPLSLIVEKLFELSK